MFISFMIGLFAGVLVMSVNQINKVNEYEKHIHKLTIQNKKEEKPTLFTYDCLNDSESDEHIPKIY